MIDTMRLEFYDAERRFTLCRLKQYIKQEEDILTRAQAGEERYSGNLGWLHVDEWAGEEKLREIETCAGRVSNSLFYNAKLVTYFFGCNTLK